MKKIKIVSKVLIDTKIGRINRTKHRTRGRVTKFDLNVFIEEIKKYIEQELIPLTK